MYNHLEVGIIPSLDDDLLLYCLHSGNGFDYGIVVRSEPYQIPESHGVYLIHHAHLMSSFDGIVLIDADRVDPQSSWLISEAHTTKRSLRGCHGLNSMAA